MPSRPSPEAPILVTGASGFLGSALAAGLADAGFSVRAGLHRAGLPSHLSSRPGVSPCLCDLDDPTRVREALRGVGLVVHAARGTEAALQARYATLLAAMAEDDVRTVVHLSSFAVYGERTGPIDETMPPVGSLGPRALAEIDCETLVRDWCAAAPADRRALVLRPGIVYGARSRLWVDRMIERIRAGAWDDFGPAGEGTAPLLHVDDLVDLTVIAVRRLTDGTAESWAPVTTLDLVGPEPPSWNAYFAALAARIGAPPLTPTGPLSIGCRQVLSLPARIWRRLGLPGGHRAALAPSVGEMGLFSRRTSHSGEAVIRVLGRGPAIDLAEGLERTLPRRTGPTPMP